MPSNQYVLQPIPGVLIFFNKLFLLFFKIMSDGAWNLSRVALPPLQHTYPNTKLN